MPEEIENLEDDDNVKEQEKVSSKSSPKNAASKADIVDFKKYKSRRKQRELVEGFSCMRPTAQSRKETPINWISSKFKTFALPKST